MFFPGGFSFGDLGSMGGPSKPVDNESMYKSLGLSKDCSDADIKKSFRKLAVQHHPDKKGDAEKFKEICRAYEVLSDPEKRQAYDQYGEEGIENSGQSNATDIFDMFFGDGRSRRGGGPPRGDDVTTQLEFTLEQFYTGVTKKMAVSRNVICSDCDGKGGPADAFSECRECNGRGLKVTIRRMGPMLTQSQAPCMNCKATGKTIPDSKKCKTCDGKAVVKERKVLEVTLMKGARDGEKIAFKGQADERPGEVAGDFVFICRQKPHATFKRKDADLFMTKTITLNEALTGISFFITHLDGNPKYLEVSPSEIIRPDDILAVQDEGMPKNGSLFSRGNLYVKFVIEFPASLSVEQKKSIQKVLPGPSSRPGKPKADVESFKLERVDPDSIHGRSNSEEDEEAHGHPGAAGVQCQQS